MPTSLTKRKSQRNHTFLCRRRLFFGPDALNLVATFCLIIFPMVVFCVFVGRQLMTNFPNHWGIAIMVVSVVHTCAVLISLLLTASRDPGIIPRDSSKEAFELLFVSSTRQPIEEIVNGKVVKRKYCDTCRHHRPLRCSHCSICNNCIDRFDHHCPWIGQCIGRRNYPFFFTFIFTSTLLCFFVIAMCSLRIKKLMDGNPPNTVWKAFQRSPASVALMAYCFLASWFVGGLTVFHTYLISTNQTTYENFRYRYYEHNGNPYDKGILSNFKEVLCSKIPPSKINESNFGQIENIDTIITALSSNKDVHGGDAELGGKAYSEDIALAVSDEGFKPEIKHGHVYPYPRDIHPDSNNVYRSEESNWNKEISPEILSMPSFSPPYSPHQESSHSLFHVDTPRRD